MVPESPLSTGTCKWSRQCLIMPREPSEIVRFIRRYGWTYHPADRFRWHKDNVSIMTADEALYLEFRMRRGT